jgi:hypothetical protein
MQTGFASAAFAHPARRYATNAKQPKSRRGVNSRAQRAPSKRVRSLTHSWNQNVSYLVFYLGGFRDDRCTGLYRNAEAAGTPALPPGRWGFP